MNQRMLRSFRPHPSALYEVRQFVRQQAKAARVPQAMADELELAVSEACANAILHSGTPDVRVSWSVENPCINVEVHDEGVFKRRVRVPEVHGVGGHGIPLMMALVDEFSIHEGTRRNPGTTVRLHKCLGS